MASSSVEIKVNLSGEEAIQGAEELEKIITAAFEDVRTKVEETGDQIEQLGQGTTEAGELLASFTRGAVQNFEGIGASILGQLNQYGQLRNAVSDLGVNLDSVLGPSMISQVVGFVTSLANVITLLKAAGPIALAIAAVELADWFLRVGQATDYFNKKADDTYKNLSKISNKVYENTAKAVTEEFGITIEAVANLAGRIENTEDIMSQISQGLQPGNLATEYGYLLSYYKELKGLLPQVSTETVKLAASMEYSEESVQKIKDIYDGLRVAIESLPSREMSDYEKGNLIQQLTRDREDALHVLELNREELEKENAALNTYEGACKAVQGEIKTLVPEKQKLLKQAALLAYEIELNGVGTENYTDRLITLRDAFVKWNVEIPPEIQNLIDQAEATEKAAESTEKLDKATAQAGSGFFGFFTMVGQTSAYMMKAVTEADKVILDAGPLAPGYWDARQRELKATIDAINAMPGLTVKQKEFLISQEQLKLWNEFQETIKDTPLPPFLQTLRLIRPELKKTDDELKKTNDDLQGNKEQLLEVAGVFNKIGSALSGLGGTAAVVGDIFGSVGKAIEDYANGSITAWEAVASAAIAAANTIGKAVGGDLGKALQGAAAGAQIGASFGGVWGAAAGAAIGAIVSVLSGSATRDSIKNYGSELGIIFSESFISQFESAVESLRDAGFSKHGARAVARATMIPEQIQEAGGTVNQEQWNLMERDLHWAYEELRKEGYGLDQTMAMLGDSMDALADQIAAGNVKMTDDFRAMISMMFQAGQVTEEFFEKIKEHVTENDLQAWATETANGLRQGTVTLGEFATQYTILSTAAQEFGYDVSGQLNDMIAAAEAAGYSMEEINQAIKEAVAEINRTELQGLIDEAMGKSVDSLASDTAQALVALVEQGKAGSEEFERMIELANDLELDLAATGDVISDAITARLNEGNFEVQDLIDLADQLGATLNVDGQILADEILQRFADGNYDIQDLVDLSGKLGINLKDYGDQFRDALKEARQELRDLRAQLKEIDKEIIDSKRNVDDLLQQRWLMNQEGGALYEAKQSLIVAIQEGEESGQQFSYNEQTGMAGYQELLAAMQGEGYMDWATIQQYMTSVPPEYQMLVLDLANSLNEKELITEQIREARQQTRELERQRQRIQEQTRVTERKLESIKHALHNLVPNKLETVHKDLRDVIEAIRKIPHAQSGGVLMRDSLVYAHAGEVITPAGHSPMALVPLTATPASYETGGSTPPASRGQTLVFNIPGVGQVRGEATISSNEIRKVVWEEIKHGTETIPAHRVGRR